jgi:LysR family hydrogen peroxide-inducible transcriptional activator
MPGRHDITLRQLEYAVAVADTLGFHRAAARCHVSQPALSAQIQQLEATLGSPLFERDRRRVLITEAGADLVARARAVLLAVDELLAAAGAHADPYAKTLRVGVIPTIAPYLLPEVTPALSRRFPRLKLIFREEKTEGIVESLTRGDLEAALVALQADLGDLETAAIGKDAFMLAVPREHRLAARKRVPVRELDRETVLLLDDGHCFREQALAVCSRARTKEAPYQATSLATLTQMVSAGLGVTLLPAMAVPVENRRGQLAVLSLESPSPSRTIALAWRRGSALASLLAEIAKVLARA